MDFSKVKTDHFANLMGKHEDAKKRRIRYKVTGKEEFWQWIITNMRFGYAFRAVVDVLFPTTIWENFQVHLCYFVFSSSPFSMAYKGERVIAP